MTWGPILITPKPADCKDVPPNTCFKYESALIEDDFSSCYYLRLYTKPHNII